MSGEWYSVEPGEWMAVKPMKEYVVKCCDCGLVHRLQFRLVDGQIQYRVWRAEAGKL